MTGRLQEKAALVTGAGSGIGQALAQRFVAEGATVFFVDRDVAHAIQAAKASIKPERAIHIEADIADEASVNAAFNEASRCVPKLDIVVANAGIQLFGLDAEAGDLSLDIRNQTIRVNLTGAFLTAKYAVRALAAAGGSLIFIGSPTGVRALGRGFTAYSTSKAGVHALAKVIAADYAALGIRSNVLIPGYTETPLVTAIAQDPQRRALQLASIPLGRPGTPHDVEGLAVYLASDESAFATGATFTVDGGRTAV